MDERPPEGISPNAEAPRDGPDDLAGDHPDPLNLIAPDFDSQGLLRWSSVRPVSGGLPQA